jgi:hypothetical protein
VRRAAPWIPDDEHGLPDLQASISAEEDPVEQKEDPGDDLYGDEDGVEAHKEQHSFPRQPGVGSLGLE